MLLVGNFLSHHLGTIAVCEELAAKLRTAGWPVLTTSDRPDRLGRVRDMVATIWRRRRDYAVAQVDVFSGAAFLNAEAACLTLRRAGKPYILTLHGGNLPAFAAGRPGRVGRLLRSAAVVTTPSGYLLERMRPFAPAGVDLLLLPNPVDLGAYAYRPRPQPRPHLVWLRAFHAIYNPALAAEVVARLAPDFPDTRLIMVGPDKGDGSRQQTEATIARLGIAHRVNLVGGVPKSEVPAWLDRGDIFLNTTTVDNTPISVMEAMAAGLCVVSTNVHGIPYLLDDGREALLVPPGDPAAMAGAVRRLLCEPGLAERLSRAARAKVERSSWEHVLPAWEGLFRRLAGETAT